MHSPGFRRGHCFPGGIFFRENGTSRQAPNDDDLVRIATVFGFPEQGDIVHPFAEVKLKTVLPELGRKGLEIGRNSWLHENAAWLAHRQAALATTAVFVKVLQYI